MPASAFFKMLNKKQKQELLKTCRKAIENYLKYQKKAVFQSADAKLQKRRGVFVSLKNKENKLRGCIGLLKSDLPLLQQTVEMAIAAAFFDPRFEPLKENELKDIIIEISILSKLKKINDWRKIKLGKEGVMLKKNEHCGVFLPQVAKEENWDLETFLQNLCLYKAALPPFCYRDPQVKIYTFTTETFSSQDFKSF